MSHNDSLKKIREEKEKWEGKTLKPALQRFKLKESPTRFYSPLDVVEGFEFLEKVGFPGQYPFTAGTFPTFPYRTGERGSGSIAQARGWPAPDVIRDTVPQRIRGITICT